MVEHQQWCVELFNRPRYHDVTKMDKSRGETVAGDGKATVRCVVFYLINFFNEIG